MQHNRNSTYVVLSAIVALASMPAVARGQKCVRQEVQKINPSVTAEQQEFGVSVAFDGTREELASAFATPIAGAATVAEYALHQNYPNPFNPETTIAFDLVEASEVMLTVFNSLGQEVASLTDGTLSQGRHTVTFAAGDLPSGIYFYRLESGDFTAMKKMVLMK